MSNNAVFIFLALIITSMPIQAGDWKNQIGLSFATGISEVADIYEDNLSLLGEVDVFLFPVGASYSGHYQFDSGLRTGFGLGPLFTVIGDAGHLEAPVNANIGWTFMPDKKFSPFVSAGVVKHIVSGDYVESDSAGLFLEAGFTYKKFGLKFVADKSEVEFQTVRGKETINSYDQVVTLFLQF
jgi:hypothetical protein